jgi:MATE family multidrug resistance protein
VDGFAYAGEALVGKAFGELKIKNEELKIKEVVHHLFNWSIGVGLVFTVIYAVWGRGSIEMMTSDTMVVERSMHYIGWLIAMPLISTLAFMWDGIYVGATAGKEIRNAMIWAAIGFVVGYVATYRWVGAQALYIAYFAHLAARVIYLTCKYEKIFNYTVRLDGAGEL